MNTDDNQQLFMPEGVSLFDAEYNDLRPFEQTDLACIYHAQDQAGRDVFVTEFAPKGHFGREGSMILPRLDLIDSFGELRSEFVKFAASLARLNHPNIEPISQYFEENGTVYAVSDAVRHVTITSELENEDFFYQPTEIEAAGKDLVDLGAYLDVFGQPNLCLSADVVSFDDASTTPYLQLRKFLDGRGRVSKRPVYRLSSTIHQMITRRLPPSYAERQSAIAQGDADPVLPLVGRFSEYDAGFLQSIDQNLALEASDRLPSFEAWKSVITQKAKKSSTPKTPKAARSGRGRIPLILGVMACLGGGAYFFLPDILAILNSQTGLAEKTADSADAPVVDALETEVAPETDGVESASLVDPAPNEPDAEEVLSTLGDITDAEEEQDAVQVEVSQPEVENDIEEEASSAETTSENATGIEDLFIALNAESTEDAADQNTTAEVSTVEEQAAVSVPPTVNVDLPVPFEIVTGSKGASVIKLNLPDDADDFLAQHLWFRDGLEIVRIKGNPISNLEALQVLLVDHVSGSDVAVNTIDVTVYDPIFDAETQANLSLLSTFK